jgi:hypothetical protein
MTTAMVLVLALGAASEPQCEVDSTFSAAEAEVLRLACGFAFERFGHLFGVLPPKGEIRRASAGRSGALRYGVGEGSWWLEWPDSVSLSERGDGTGWREQSRTVLPHEIGHLLLQVHSGAAPSADGPNYGTFLPDWLEEGVAVWMEPGDARWRRVAQLDSLPLPLFRLFGSVHPAMTLDPKVVQTRLEGPCRGCGDPDLQAGMYVLLTARQRPTGILEWTRQVLTSEEAQSLKRTNIAAFYGESFAAVSLIREVCGAAGVATLLARLLHNPADRAAVRGLPGLPSDSTALEALWMRHISSLRARTPEQHRITER